MSALALADPPAPALALNEVIDTPSSGRVFRCTRVPEYWKLVDTVTGECFSMRCRATNKCDYCRMLAATETVEMLLLDADGGDPPTLMLTLTARRFPEGRELDRTLRKLTRAGRRPWPDLQWFATRERQARGALHLHLLVKHVPDDEESMRKFYELVTRIWCARHDAEALRYEQRASGAQGLKRITHGEGLVRYLTKDLTGSLRSIQAVPAESHAHRTSQTRNYFPGGVTAARKAARESLRRRRAEYSLRERGYSPEEIEAKLKTVTDGSRKCEPRMLHHGVWIDFHTPPRAMAKLRPRRRSSGLAKTL